MEKLLHIDQNPKFPEIYKGVILNTPGSNSIKILDYGLNMSSYINENNKYNFYYGFIPMTFINEYPIYTSFFTVRKLDVFDVVDLQPIYAIKILSSFGVLNIIFGKPSFDEIVPNKEYIIKNIEEFFKPDKILVEYENIAKRLLEEGLKGYNSKYIKIRKNL